MTDGKKNFNCDDFVLIISSEYFFYESFIAACPTDTFQLPLFNFYFLPQRWVSLVWRKGLLLDVWFNLVIRTFPGIFKTGKWADQLSAPPHDVTRQLDVAGLRQRSRSKGKGNHWNVPYLESIEPCARPRVVWTTTTANNQTNAIRSVKLYSCGVASFSAKCLRRC